MASITSIFANLEDPRVLVFFLIIQAGFAVYCGLSVAGIRLKLNELLTAGITIGVFNYFERGLMAGLNYATSTHYVIEGVIFILAIRYFFKLPLSAVGLASLSNILVIAISETWVNVPFGLLHIELSKSFSKPWDQIAAGLASSIPLLLIGIIAYRLRYSRYRRSWGGYRRMPVKITDLGVQRIIK